jgi:hypothetical protein
MCPFKLHIRRVKSQSLSRLSAAMQRGQATSTYQVRGSRAGARHKQHILKARNESAPRRWRCVPYDSICRSAYVKHALAVLFLAWRGIVSDLEQRAQKTTQAQQPHEEDDELTGRGAANNEMKEPPRRYLTRPVINYFLVAITHFTSRASLLLLFGLFGLLFE